MEKIWPDVRRVDCAGLAQVRADCFISSTSTCTSTFERAPNLSKDRRHLGEDSDVLRSDFFGVRSDPIQQLNFGSRSDPNPQLFIWI